MSVRIPNSNQFSNGDNGTTYAPSDFTFWTPGSSLPDTQENDIPSELPINVTLTLRRNQFETERKPKNFIPADRLLNRSYKKQIEYINELDEEKLISWYGASDHDIQAVTSYITQYGAANIKTVKESREVTFSIGYEQFKNAFLKGRDDIITSISNDTDWLYYYNPEDYTSSYLTASGNGALEFASAIIGIENSIEAEAQNNTAEMKQAGAKASENQPEGADMMYYPTELARLYNFPSPDKTGAGKGVTIGLMGSGGNQFELFNQGNAFNKYLKAQGIDIRRLGKVDSPNNAGADDPETDWGEFGLDYSILRSIAPRADLVISQNDVVKGYQDLIYNPEIDIISSSVGEKPLPGIINQNEVIHELFVDGLLRGKSIVVAAGDQGTGNYGNTLLPNGNPRADYWDGDSAILSVGGTAFAPEAQLKGWARAQVKSPTALPPQYTGKTIDKITGLINEQLMWNQYGFNEITDKTLEAWVERGDKVYPSLQSQFTMDDFVGSTYVENEFVNVAGSSGVFGNAVQRMPGYQERNLGRKWQGTGRRYPDVSVLAGSNTEEGANSEYYVFDLQNGKPVLTAGSGTSAGAPLLAGLLATITSGLRKKFGKEAKTAFVNPYLYEKYNSNQAKKLFIDVPTGSNNASTYQVASSLDQWQGNYTGIVQRNNEQFYILPLNGTGPNGTLDLNLSSTGRGFDAASGLGSINGQALFDGLTQVWSTI